MSQEDHLTSGKDGTSRYEDKDNYPYPAGHALHGVPWPIFVAARHVLEQAAVWKDVDPEQADPIADAVIISLLPWLTWEG